MRFGFIISLLFAIIVALLSIQNATVISVNFFSQKFYISLALIIFVSVVIGAIIVTLLGLQKEFKLSRGNKRLTKKANNFQAEIENYKNENVDLKIENEALKSEAKALETKIEALEANNKIINDEISVLTIEIDRLNTISTSETIILK